MLHCIFLIVWYMLQPFLYGVENICVFCIIIFAHLVAFTMIFQPLLAYDGGDNAQGKFECWEDVYLEAAWAIASISECEFLISA